MEKKIVLLALMVIVIISFSIYFFIQIDFERVIEVKKIENNYNVDLEYEIEDIIYSHNDVIIKGWLGEVGSPNNYINRRILLKSEDGTIISIKTEAEDRNDLSIKNTSETIYNKCGLIGRIKKNKLDKEKKYQIGFMVISQDEKVKVVFSDKVIDVS